jgi:hypothetical protein
MDFSKHLKLEFRRKFWKFFGAAIHVFDADSEEVVGYIEMKAWKLREDIRLFKDMTKAQEVLRIHARNIIDLAATYDVYDSGTDKVIFSFRRKGMSSTFVRDKWVILDASDNVIALLTETSGGLAIARRYIGVIPILGPIFDLVFMVVPLTYQIEHVVGGKPAGVGARLVHRKNPVIVKMGLDMSGTETPIDPRIGVAAASLLSVIDESKN